MADINFRRFADDVKTALGPLSYSKAIVAWPDLNFSMLSRAANGRTLSAGNFLLLCACLDLDPWTYLFTERPKRRTMKDVLNQHLSEGASRETTP